MTLFEIAIILLTDVLMVNPSLTMSAKYNSVLGKIIEVKLEGTKVLQLNANGSEGRGVRVVWAVKEGGKERKEERDCATRSQIENIFLSVF